MVGPPPAAGDDPAGGRGAARRLDEASRTELAEIMNTSLPMRPRVAGAVFDRAADALLAPHEDADAFVARLADGRLLELSTGGHVLIGNVARLREEVGSFLA